MKCVILSPRHSSELQGSAFQPKLSQYVIAIDHCFNSELRREIRKRDRIRKTVKNIANNQISTNTRNREIELII